MRLIGHGLPSKTLFILLMALFQLGLPAPALVPSSSCLRPVGSIAMLGQPPLNDGNREQFGENNNWINIPDWLSGTWETRSQLLVDGYDYTNHRKTVDQPRRIPVKRVTKLGSQRDLAGRIWHFAGTPYIKVISTESFIERQCIEQISLVSSSNVEVVVATIAKVMRFDKGNQDLLDIYTEQSTTTYKPIDDGLIEVTYIVCDFNMQGQPIYASKMICAQNRTEAFRPAEQNERGDLKAKFQQFMLENNLGQYLPKY